MFKKYLIAAALGLGLLSAAPAAADTRVGVTIQAPGISAHVGEPGYRFPYKREYYRNYRHYRSYPVCDRWEVAVRSPYDNRRYICVETDNHYDRHRRYNDWRDHQ